MKFSVFPQKKGLFFLFLFALVFVFRSPTLFNDYYDADELAAIVQTSEYMAGDIPGRDFSESKKPLYHSIFKLSYSIAPDNGWVMVHFITILIVFVTALFIYGAGKHIRDHNTGAWAAIFYGVLISSFNRHFMATNGEIVYNLFLAGGLYFFLRSLTFSAGFLRIMSFALALVMGYAAFQVKFHGIILFIFIALFLFLYMPYYYRGFSRGLLPVLVISLIILIAALVLGTHTGLISVNDVLNEISKKIYYASAAGRGFNFINFIMRYIHRQGMLSLWHMILWVPAFGYVLYFIRNRFRGTDLCESAVFLFLVSTFFMVFGGGARLYFHYFMAAYPMLCIVSSLSLNHYSGLGIVLPTFIKKKPIRMLYIPAVFFLVWNYKDVSIRNFCPQAFYNEGRFLYWTRAVLIGQFNDYLLPHRDYLDVVKYIKEHTHEQDRIFVWGDGPYLYYFSDRRLGGVTLWPKNRIYSIRDLYVEGTESSVKKAMIKENDMLEIIKYKRPVLFIDTSPSGFTNFRAPVDKAPLLNKYIQRNYRFVKEINKMRIYERKS